ncbi:DUF3168 domain-containing protein [Methylorubrum rhodesianum]|uniref:tail completion protein gp17 n=1 Tax=Methylorubrum rhodesianum TaxID=29427 RepID=UPI003D2A1EB3
MTSAITLTIAMLKANVPVGAIVSDRIEPEMAKNDQLPRIVVRQASGRRTYGLAKATGLREARVNVLCAAKTFTAADRLASAVIAALENGRHQTADGTRVKTFQDGDDTGTAEPNGSSFTRIVGFRVSASR